MHEWRQNLGRDPDGEARLRGVRDDWWWTGIRPQACPGFVDGALRALPPLDLRRCTADTVQAYFDNGWTLTELLFAGLEGAEAFYRPPDHRLRHPLIFYYAHSAVFYVNKLRVAGLLRGPLNPEFERIFEVGVDEMSWDDYSMHERLWPTIAAIHSYRRDVYARVSATIAQTFAGAATRTVVDASPAWALLMGFEHERIHLETSSVLIRELAQDLVRRPAAWPALHPSVSQGHPGPPRPDLDYRANAMISIPAGTVEIGKPREVASFSWDNAYGRRSADLPAFEVSRQLVSNGEFYEFVRQGGYQTPRFWSERGWKWRRHRNTKWPAFWRPSGPEGLHQYRLRTVFETVEMPWSWPVIVNYYEAKAYCRWRSEATRGEPLRLLTEAEHHRLRDSDSAAILADANIGLRFGGESPTDASATSRSGCHDLFGNVWTWCEDHFHPLEGFEVHPYYEDFSTPCFDGEHQMIFGGSFASAGDEASVWARFHFRPHFFQHAGFRLVQPQRSAGRGQASVAVLLEDNVYESPRLLGEYAMLHYGGREQMPYDFGPADATSFPTRMARDLCAAAKGLGLELGRALDLGCAVGGASFELARDFAQVVGVELSASFVTAAQTMQREGALSFWRVDEGEIGAEVEVRVDPTIDRDRVGFRRADACALPSELEGFDAVLMTNLLDRLVSPRSCLERLGGRHGLVRPGGLLLLTSPYTWMKEFTPRRAWLGGYVDADRERWTFAGLQAALDPEFELLEVRDVPLLIREHARKFQYIVTHASLWRRRQ